MGGLGGEDSSSSKEPSFLEQNLRMFMDMSIRVCEAESKGSFYHAQRVLRVCLQEHTDEALSYLFSTSEDKESDSPPPLFQYFDQLLRHVHEPGAIDMLIDLLCLPPRTSESSAFSNATDAESQDNLMMMMMMQPTTELLSSYQCSSVVKHKYYKAVSDSEVLVSLVCRAADSRLNQDHADASAEAFDFVLKHLSGDCDGTSMCSSVILSYFNYVRRISLKNQRSSRNSTLYHNSSTHNTHTHTNTYRCNRVGVLPNQTTSDRNNTLRRNLYVSEGGLEIKLEHDG